MATYANLGYIGEESELDATYIRRDDYVAKGQIGTYNTATGSFDLLPPGPNGYVLSSDSLSTYGLTWIVPPNEDINPAVPGANTGGSGLTIVEPSPGVTELAVALSGAAAGVYGNSTNVPVITVNSQGIITNVANTAISFTDPLLSVATRNWGAASSRDVGISDNVVIGDTASSSGQTQTLTLGSSAICNGSSAVSAGYDSSAASQAVAVGSSAVCNSSGVVVGYNSKISGGAVGTVVVGPNNAGISVTGPNNLIMGNATANTLTSGSGNILCGASVSVSSGTASNAIGIGLLAGTNSSSIVIGANSSTSATNASIVGTSSTISVAGTNSCVFGPNNASTAIDNTTMGYNNTNAAQAGIIVGKQNTLSVAATDAIVLGRLASSTNTSTITCGVSALTGGVDSISLGRLTQSLGNTSVSIGLNNRSGAGSANSILIGNGNARDLLTGQGNIVIGSSNITTLATTANNNIMIGSSLNVVANSTSQGILISTNGTIGSNAIGIGGTCTVTSSGGIGIGVQPSVTGSNGLAICQLANVSAADGLAIGRSSAASAADALAICRSSAASAIDAISVGRSSVSNQQGAIAIGNTAIAAGVAMVCIGGAAGALTNTGSNVVIVGNNSGRTSTGNQNTLLGAYSDASATRTNITCVGYIATAQQNNSTICGSSTTATASNANIFGYNITNANADTTLIGCNNVTAHVVDSQGLFRSVNQVHCVASGSAQVIGAGPTTCTLGSEDSSYPAGLLDNPNDWIYLSVAGTEAAGRCYSLSMTLNGTASVTNNRWIATMWINEPGIGLRQLGWSQLCASIATACATSLHVEIKVNAAITGRPYFYVSLARVVGAGTITIDDIRLTFARIN